VFKLSIPEPAAANLSPLQQKFQRVLQHNIQHEGSSILCWAAGQKSVSLMETLLDQYHADVNAVHGDKTPLINAVMSGFLAAVEQVLSRRELDLNYFNQGHRALWYSTAQKDSAIAQRLLRQPGMEINRPLQAKNGKILTIFNEAVIRNNTAVVKVILADERTDLNIAAESMRTPLLCATDRGHLGIVKLLLGDPRVDPVCRDARGYSALHYAAEDGDVQLVDLFLADGRIDVGARNYHESTALHLVAKAGHIGVVNRLLMASAIDCNAKNRKGRTALWNATRQGHDQVASRLLIGEDLEVNSTATGESTDRSTSLHHAVKARSLALVYQLLAKSSADPNVPDEGGRTPLWWAAAVGDLLLVMSLRDDPRTQPDIRDHNGLAPVDIARSRNDHEVVRLLTNCRHHCPAVIFAEVVMIVILIPILLLLSLASVVRRALARVCIL
jgi:ankyrin repeat protein